MIETYDAIVIGCGGFGSSTLYHLARRGSRVLGLERFGIAHDRGSSHGQTRIIRKAYFEHPDYVPLLQRAYALWGELESASKRKLLHPIGLLIAGAPACESVAGTLQAARRHALPIETFTAREAARRFPAYRFGDEMIALHEADAGYLEVEHCVATHLELASEAGADLHLHETVVSWTADGAGVLVRTDRGEYRAGRLIVTAGPWAASVLSACSAGVDESYRDWLKVVRKPVFWFPASEAFDTAAGNCTFFFETTAGQFYGFPRIDGATIKVAEHTQGDPLTDPGTVDRGLHPADLERVRGFLDEHIPTVAPEPTNHSVCMYTRSPDGHFIIDRHPEFPQVVLGMGFSGHGFKFTTVLGEALADLALQGETALPIGFLSADRLQKRSV
jgi:sarcosine oxidase